MSRVDIVQDITYHLDVFETLNASNILKLALRGAQYIERYSGLKGADKKSIVMEVLSNLVKAKGANEAILEPVPDFIDTAIALDKGSVVINPKVDVSNVACCCSTRW